MEQEMTQWTQFITEKAIELSVAYAPKIAGAILLLIFGIMVIRKISSGFKSTMIKKNIDAALTSFLSSILGYLLYTVLVLAVMGILGVAMTSFAAILASAGLAVGMALSGTLQNFAGGVLILILKPYKIGDYITAQGHSGSVHELNVFNTVLKTPDNKTIIVPNGGISTGSLVNYSEEETRRVDWTVGVAYGTNVKVVRDLIFNVLDQDERVLKDPERVAFLGEMADSSINMTVRAWVKTEEYWDVFFDTNEKFYEALNSAGIEIPFPQMDVHLTKND